MMRRRRSAMPLAFLVGFGLLAVVPAAPAQGTDATAMTDPIQPEITARLGLPLGNATFTPEGRVIVSHHPMFERDERVSEVVSPDTLRPFPNLHWNTPRPGADDYLDSVLGLRSDERGVVWMLDMGARTNIVPRLVAWDTRADRLERVIPLPPPATVRHSEPNDLVLDPRNEAIYIADEGVGRNGDGSDAALIVVSTRTGQVRRVLQGHASTKAEDVPVTVDGREMRKQGGGLLGLGTAPMRVGADGIALDHRSEWLYFGQLSGRFVHRVRVADLLDESLDGAALGARVERYAERPNGGGMSIDAADNLYLTEVGGRAVGIVPASDRRYRRYATHPDMLWPDGLSAGPDGFLYVTIAQLPLAPPLNGGKDGSAAPYLMARFRTLAPTRLGH